LLNLPHADLTRVTVTAGRNYLPHPLFLVFWRLREAAFSPVTAVANDTCRHVRVKVLRI